MNEPLSSNPSFAQMIEQARKWPRDSYGEGYWFNAMADMMESLLDENRNLAAAVRAPRLPPETSASQENCTHGYLTGRTCVLCGKTV